MKLHKEFMVGRARDQVAAQLDDPHTLGKLFPGTRIEERPDGSRETFTPFKSLGQSREVRFVFRTQPDGDVSFEKVCDGNVWRSLDGEIHIVGVDERMTSVAIGMEGQTVKSLAVSPHDPGVKEALLALEFAGEGPDEVLLVGVIPGNVEQSVGLTPPVQAAVPTLSRTSASPKRCYNRTGKDMHRASRPR